MRVTGFCCAGCQYVYRMVQENGLAGYYGLKEDVTAPADPAVFQPRDFGWLESAQREAELASEKVPELKLDVQGISCAGCVWLIERIVQQQPGARGAFVNAQYGTMRLSWVRGEFSAPDLGRKLQRFGYILGSAGSDDAEPESRSIVKRIGLCAAFAMNVMLFSLPVYFGMDRSFEWAGLFGILSFAFGTLSFLVGGIYFLGRAARALRERVMHIDLPIALGILGAYGGSLYGWLANEERFIYFDFVATFILLMLVGRWAQTAAVERNRRRLLKQQPKPHRVRLQSGAEIPPEQIHIGQMILITAGETLPVEGTLESEGAAFSLASINGESEPRVFRCGERIPGGGVNVGRAEVVIKTSQVWSESLLAKLLQETNRVGARQALLERIVQGYIIGVLVVAAGAGMGWWWATGDALRTAAVVTAILVVSCPCAIGLAFPLTDEMATVALRRRGVFVREEDLWAKLHRVRHVVFDKTGTLTLETPVLSNRDALRDLDPEARSALFALVRDNPHPICECLRAELLASGPCDPLVGEVTETVGKGISLGYWSLGKSGWMSEGVPSSERETDGPADAVLIDGKRTVATFRFVDRPRSDARQEIAALQALGLSVCILSGDRSEKVMALAGELGLSRDQAIGNASPDDKRAWLESHGADRTLMLGDGANDSFAFDSALCRGTPVIHRGVLERKADFYYLGRGISGIRAMFEVDRVRRRTHWAIMCFSVAYNVSAVGLAVCGHMNPLIAAVVMPLNSLLTLGLVATGMRAAFRR